MPINESIPTKDHGPSWLLVGSIALFLFTCCLFAWSVSPFLDGFRAKAFTGTAVSRKGYDWPREDFSDDGQGRFHSIYLAPDDSGRRLDVTVQRGTNDEWKIVEFKEWVHKWNDATASR